MSIQTAESWRDNYIPASEGFDKYQAQPIDGGSSWCRTSTTSSARSTARARSSDWGANTISVVAGDGTTRVLEGHGDTPFAIAFSPDGARVYSVSSRVGVCSWRTVDGALERTFDLP